MYACMDVGRWQSGACLRQAGREQAAGETRKGGMDSRFYQMARWVLIFVVVIPALREWLV